MISWIKQLYKDERGIAALEVALMLPILMVLMLGAIDTGNAIVVNKKTMTASSIVADLLTRNSTVNDAAITDAWLAAQMAIDPYNRTRLGLDIASIQFQGAQANPVVVWRQTYNMTPNADVIQRATGLGVQGEGVMIVTTRYVYRPVFSSVVTDDVVMQEVAVTRGRRSSFVARE